jgi:predicted helicase
MKINVLGYQTHRDKFAVDTNLNKLINRINDFADNSIVDSDLKRKYNINESNDWVLKNQRRLLKNEKKIIDYISLTSYRPFDNQYAILNKVICDRPRKEILQHILNKDNLCLLNSKQQAIEGFRHCFISKLPANDCVMSTTSREANQVFPLYLYPDNNAQQTIDQQQERTPNLNMEIVKEIAEKLGMVFVNEKVSSTSSETYVTGNSVGATIKPIYETAEPVNGAIEPVNGTVEPLNAAIEHRNGTVEPLNAAIELVEIAPIDILDYIYAVLHSPTYREKYKEFLKIDFPRFPYPKDQETFRKLVKLGEKSDKAIYWKVLWWINPFQNTQLRELTLLLKLNLSCHPTRSPLKGRRFSLLVKSTSSKPITLKMSLKSLGIFISEDINRHKSG